MGRHKRRIVNRIQASLCRSATAHGSQTPQLRVPVRSGCIYLFGGFELFVKNLKILLISSSIMTSALLGVLQVANMYAQGFFLMFDPLPKADKSLTMKAKKLTGTEGRASQCGQADAPYHDFYSIAYS